MKKLLFIYNPNSGKGKIQHHIDEVVDIFEANDYEVMVHRTKGPGDGKFVAATKGRDVELIVCSGGDGTLSEIVAGVMTIEKEERPRIGFIPVGSTNDTGKSFGLPFDVCQAAEVAVQGHPFATDVGSFNDTYFTYVASLGKLSAVSCFTPQEAKRVFGYAAYLVEGIKALLRMDAYDLIIEYEDAEGREHVLEGNYYLGMVTNTLSVGGFKDITGGHVELDDGLFEVAMLKRPKSFHQFNRQIDTMLLSPDRDASNDLANKFKTRKIRFTSKDEVQWVIDGENAGKHKVVEIENIGKAVRLMTLASTKKEQEDK